MPQFIVIKKISLIICYLLFVAIEILALVLIKPEGHEKAYYLQLIAVAATLILIFIQTKSFTSSFELQENGWTKLRKYVAFFLVFSIVSLFAFQVLTGGALQTGKNGFLGIGFYGLLLGLMYGENWKIHLLNGIAWMQGLNAIEWAISSANNFLQPGITS